MRHSMTLTGPQLKARVIDDIEREDQDTWLEPHDDDAFHQLVRRLVAEGDHHAAQLGRRAPRTLAEMRARINIQAGTACPDCQGAGGRTVDTSSGGVTRKSWESCGSCNGLGVR
ncbi:hypothetical protein ABZ348_30510 [Streptomyces sp. NPDC005963]|uniref:hypothetical protein n=1 Tax=Streptomyces sp. NPDC005963 TaxID=3156721 RepID=UPI00340D2E2F